MITFPIIKEFLVANKNMVAAISGLVALAISLHTLYGHVYDTGYKAAEVYFTKKQNEAIEEQRSAYEEKIKETISKMQKDHDEAIDRIKKEEKVIVRVDKVIEYVDKEILVEKECLSLASNVVRVLQQATRIVGDSASSGD